jgi:hypothetical protein
MPDLPAIVCVEHAQPLVPDGPGRLRCPEPGCAFGFITSKDQAFAPLPAQPAMPPSPIGPLGQTAVDHNELVGLYQAAGFSRSEAMQVLCCVITAGIMKGSGSSER